MSNIFIEILLSSERVSGDAVHKTRHKEKRGTKIVGL
jgi:hypothetical protein